MVRTSFVFPFPPPRCGPFLVPVMLCHLAIAVLGFEFWPLCETGKLAKFRTAVMARCASITHLEKHVARADFKPIQCESRGTQSGEGYTRGTRKKRGI
jgi:hypothetical protein